MDSEASYELSRQEQVDVIHQRRFLTQLQQHIERNQYLVDRTRAELHACRDHIEGLAADRDAVVKSIEVAENAGDM